MSLEQSAASKVCTSCREDVPLDGFYKHPDTKDGKQSWCKACVLKANRIRSEAASCSSEFAVTQDLAPDDMYLDDRGWL